MREIVKKQLDKCQFADLSNFDKETNVYYIPKYTKPLYDINKCYIVKLADYVLKDPNSVLATNWNQGKLPQTNHLKIYVSKILGKMIYVDSIGFDINTGIDQPSLFWSGWLNIDDLAQLQII